MMAGEEIDSILNKRAEFLNFLDKDIQTNKEICDKIKNDLKALQETRKNIDELGKQPKHKSLIPLCKKMYVPGRIVHTGEYMLKKKGLPNSYLMLKTLDQTSKHLDKQIAGQQKRLEKAKLFTPQLEERKKLLLGQIDEKSLLEQFVEDVEHGLSADVAIMPKEIRSNKGVAVKVGDFYEIFEYEC